MTKIGRNDPCPCGSGKKYKKCCEAKDSSPRKLSAHKIEGEAQANKTLSLSGLFQKMSFPPAVRLGDALKPLDEGLEEPKKDNSEPPAQDPPEKT